MTLVTAADSVIIPVQAQYLPAKGMTQLLWMNCLQTQKAMNCCTAPPGLEDKPMPEKKRTEQVHHSIQSCRPGAPADHRYSQPTGTAQGAVSRQRRPALPVLSRNAGYSPAGAGGYPYHRRYCPPYCRRSEKNDSEKTGAGKSTIIRPAD